MRLRSLVAAFIAFTTLASSMYGKGVEGHLEGCPDPQLIAKALRELRQSNWHEVTVAKVQAMWPTELLGIDCDRNVCRSVGSKERIISGRYECSETFFFDVKANENGTQKTELQNLVIHYSGDHREGVLAAGRTFAMAAGLSATKAARIGQERHQDFQWEDVTSDVLSGLNVELSKNGSVWTVTLNLSRFPK